MEFKQALATLVFLILIVWGINYSINEFQKQRTYPLPSGFESIDIKNIVARPGLSGNYDTEGYVAFAYFCSPCPAPAECAPCERNYIIASESPLQSSELTVSDLKASAIKIFAVNPLQFETGGKYKFSVRIINDGSADFFKNIEMLGYRKLS